MSTTEITVLVIVLVLLVVAVAAFVAWRRQQQLKRTFGPEYDRTVEQSGGVLSATRELSGRTKRRDALDIRPLDEQSRQSYALAWRDVQEQFVDAPDQAVRNADALIGRVMHDRGYPVQDFEQQARDVSVDHAHVVEHYRSAHDVQTRSARGETSTEDLRTAMVHYRALFDDLLEPDREHSG